MSQPGSFWTVIQETGWLFCFLRSWSERVKRFRCACCHPSSSASAPRARAHYSYRATRASRHQRAKIAAHPIGAAFLGAIATLWLVATQGPITIRFYDPASLSQRWPSRMGFYIDRLSAVHDGIDLRCRHHHLHLFHRLYVSRSPRSPVSGAHRIHDLCRGSVWYPVPTS